MFFYSKSTAGFYADDIHGQDMPDDVVVVSEADYKDLMVGQEKGLRIIARADGTPELAAQAAPTVEQVSAALESRVQNHLDAIARSLGYDSIYTACSYADEAAVPKFQAEGQALRRWRSLVWEAANAIRAEVESLSRPVPTAAELIAALPEFSL